MDNAKDELLKFLKEHRVDLLCAEIEEVYYDIDKSKRKSWLLSTKYSPDDLNQFLEMLDFKFDGGYGSQYLGGTLWLDDGGYADRGEYDGSEWWEYHKTPAIPDYLDLDKHTKDNDLVATDKD